MLSSQDAGDATAYAYDPTKTGKSELPDGSAYALEAFKANKAKEPTTVGDMAAMREALKMFVDAYSTTSYTLCIENLRPAYQKATAALSAPPRNCDVYDAKTAEKEFVRQTGSKSIRTKSVRWLYAPADGGNGDVK